MSTLEIDSLILPTESLLEFDQQYADLVQRDFRRTADNSGVLRVTGSAKVATTIDAKGWIPAGFTSLDVGSTYTLKCVMVRSADSASTTVTLPAGRRADTDHEPIGLAVVDDRTVATTITNLAAILAGSTDDATLTAVTGASAYRVHYWPQITAVILANSSKGTSLAEFEWQLEAEEI